MPEVLPSRSSSIRTYSAVALFLLVYAGVMVLVFAPPDLFGVEAGVAVYSED